MAFSPKCVPRLPPAPFQMTLGGSIAIVIFHNFRGSWPRQQSAPFVAVCTLSLLANAFIPAGRITACGHLLKVDLCPRSCEAHLPLHLSFQLILNHHHVFRQDCHAQHRPQDPVCPCPRVACIHSLIWTLIIGSWDTVPGRPLLVRLATASTRP